MLGLDIYHSAGVALAESEVGSKTYGIAMNIVRFLVVICAISTSVIAATATPEEQSLPDPVYFNKDWCPLEAAMSRS
jgi:hypothetical protein